MFYLNPVPRRLTYVALFELIAIFFSSLLLSGMSEGEVASSLPVAVTTSVVAVVWNYIYNTLFERWERKNNIQKRTLLIRIVHTTLFEAMFIILIVPFFMWFYNVGLVKAFMMEVGLLTFFFVYAFVFTWLFDRVFVREPIPAT
ncbi:PACE efflux transporter [Pseudescherichia vulneris]|uniref:PACE efflux transporter n=1 Tax=Pseudescherichia vulneris TaxID=566 RepID=UPI00227C8EF7|nr:PACE efflux transporter [Pseudescherichia vulneris]WAH52977.1 PACE efflux transporter [Pseudescherichia vulneris]